MKKEIILQGMGWGHLPEFVVRRELRQKRWLAIAGKHLPGGVSSIVAARRHDLPHGPIAARLWRHIGEQAAQLRRSAPGPPASLFKPPVRQSASGPPRSRQAAADAADAR